MGDYYHAIPWLEEAVSLFRGSYGEWKTEDEASLEDAAASPARSFSRRPVPHSACVLLLPSSLLRWRAWLASAKPLTTSVSQIPAENWGGMQKQLFLAPSSFEILYYL